MTTAMITVNDQEVAIPVAVLDAACTEFEAVRAHDTTATDTDIADAVASAVAVAVSMLPTPTTDDVLTISQAAAYLKLSDQHVRRLAERGDLPARKLGDRWRFSRPALLRHLEGGA